ncbi:MAG TPA: short chain dehydrogenase [Fimbriimonadaceae bacterium]
MKVIVIGARGLIGGHVASALAEKHEIIRVSRKEGDFKADITDKASLEKLFNDAGSYDAVVCCSGGGAFKPLQELTDEDFEFSLHSKLMGQVNVARTGLAHLTNGGSITLTSGVLAVEPAQSCAAISLINAGVEGFVRSAALDIAPNFRLNVVSPPWISETLQAMGKDLSQGMPAAKCALAYVECVQNTALTGNVVDARSWA